MGLFRFRRVLGEERNPLGSPPKALPPGAGAGARARVRAGPSPVPFTRGDPSPQHYLFPPPPGLTRRGRGRPSRSPPHAAAPATPPATRDAPRYGSGTFLN